jgi:hypothetical protein
MFETSKLVKNIAVLEITFVTGVQLLLYELETSVANFYLSNILPFVSGISNSIQLIILIIVNYYIRYIQILNHNILFLYVCNWVIYSRTDKMAIVTLDPK